MSTVTCGECPYHIQPIGIATEHEIPANKSIVAELGLLCPRDTTLVVDLDQHACDHVTHKLESRKRKRSKK